MDTTSFPPLKNDLLIRAAYGKPVERVPVWIMRQAGRYLPEFRAMREKHDFFTICQTPELAAEVTLQPIRRFDLDAAIIFSDILVIPQALGMKVEMVPGVGPVFPEPLKTIADLDNLPSKVDVSEKLGYVYKAITLTRLKLEGACPLIGFSGGPWTLMSYMIEGKGSPTKSKAKSWLYSHPNESQQLLQLLTEVITDHLYQQVMSGAQVLQVFESHAGLLGPDQFEVFILPYLRAISQNLRFKLKAECPPLIVFAKDAFYALDELSDSGYDVVSLDWTIEPQSARNMTHGRVTLQGNLDPCALYSDKESLQKLTRRMLTGFGTTRYIANLGHGIYPDMDPDLVAVFIDAVHDYNTEMLSSKDST